MAHEVRYTLRARADLEQIYDYLDKRAPAAARSIKSAIERQIRSLSAFPFMASTTDDPDVRALTLTQHPYKIYYEVVGENVRILHIRHTSRRPMRPHRC
jgi:toxin ParE1/3/4